MTDVILALFAGMLIGWNVMPQPAWIRSIWLKLVAKFKKED